MADQLFEIRTDDKDHQRAMRKMQQDLDKVNARYVKLSQTVARGSKEQKSFANFATAGITRAVSSVTAMASGFLSVQSAVQAVNFELEKQIRLSTKAAETQLRTAKSQRDFLINTAGLPEEQVQRAIDETKAIALRTSVLPEKLFQPLAGAFSASGGDLPAALKAVETAALARPEDPGSLASFILDVSRLTGSKEPTQNAAVLIAALNEARTEDPGLFAKNAIPAALNVAQVGKTSPEFALSTVTALTTRLTDVTGGGGSAAAATKFATALQDAIPGEQDIADVLAQARTDPVLRKSISDRLEKGLTKSATEELLVADSDVTRSQLQALQNLPKGDGLQAFATNFFERVESTPLQQIDKFSRAIDTRIGLQELDSASSPSGVLLSKQDRLLDQLGVSLGERIVLHMRQFNEGTFARDPAGPLERLIRQTAEPTVLDRPTITDEQRKLAQDTVRLLEEVRDAIARGNRNTAGRTVDQNVRD